MRTRKERETKRVMSRTIRRMHVLPLMLTACLIVLPSLLIVTSSAAKQSPYGYRNTQIMTEATDVEEVYTFDKLWNLLFQDVTRWLAILEDVIAEVIRAHFFNGLVDRKTIKVGIRYFTQNAFISLQEQGFFPSSTLSLSPNRAS